MSVNDKHTHRNKRLVETFKSRNPRCEYVSGDTLTNAVNCGSGAEGMPVGALSSCSLCWQTSSKQVSPWTYRARSHAAAAAANVLVSEMASHSCQRRRITVR
jgi:hypothetical protein